jgi:hypothetical protein
MKHNGGDAGCGQTRKSIGSFPKRFARIPIFPRLFKCLARISPHTIGAMFAKPDTALLYDFLRKMGQIFLATIRNQPVESRLRRILWANIQRLNGLTIRSIRGLDAPTSVRGATIAMPNRGRSDLVWSAGEIIHVDAHRQIIGKPL